ncbi:MAG: serine hydrolase [Parachlamydiaceae bacterium]|nr:serine hydrolase [Parachlamydiaceae bacterium]
MSLLNHALRQPKKTNHGTPKLCFLALIFPLLFSSFTNAAPFSIEQTHVILPELEKQIEAGMKRTRVPGIAVGIIINNKVVYSKGFGERKIGENAPITADTVFQVASVSKPLTSTVIAALVGENVLQWNSKINQLDPQFLLKDPWVSSEVTIEDLLSHRSGLPDHAGDILEDLGFDQKTILHQLRLEPITEFRKNYKYTNFGFTEAALAAAKIAGVSWDTLVHQKMLNPLGMASTSTNFDTFINNPNHADLHVMEEGIPKALFQRNPDAQTPAGGFSMSMNDFCKWMLLQISEGKFNGKQLIPADTLKQTHLPYITRGPNSFYGLGWNISYNTKDEAILSHAGMFSLGAITTVKIIPSKGFGIAVFANAAVTGLPEAIIDIFMDLQRTGQIEKDWVPIWEERVQALFGHEKKSFNPIKIRSEPLPNNAYVGSYANEYYGEANVTEKNGKLYLTVRPMEESFPLNPLNRDVFSFESNKETINGMSPVLFTIDETGIANQFLLEAFNANGLGIFKKHKPGS